MKRVLAHEITLEIKTSVGFGGARALAACRISTNRANCAAVNQVLLLTVTTTQIPIIPLGFLHLLTISAFILFLPLFSRLRSAPCPLPSPPIPTPNIATVGWLALSDHDTFCNGFHHHLNCRSPLRILPYCNIFCSHNYAHNVSNCRCFTLPTAANRASRTMPWLAMIL